MFICVVICFIDFVSCFYRLPLFSFGGYMLLLWATLNYQGKFHLHWINLLGQSTTVRPQKGCYWLYSLHSTLLAVFCWKRNSPEVFQTFRNLLHLCMNIHISTMYMQNYCTTCNNMAARITQYTCDFSTRKFTKKNVCPKMFIWVNVLKICNMCVWPEYICR